MELARARQLEALSDILLGRLGLVNHNNSRWLLLMVNALREKANKKKVRVE